MLNSVKKWINSLLAGVFAEARLDQCTRARSLATYPTRRDHVSWINLSTLLSSSNLNLLDTNLVQSHSLSPSYMYTNSYSLRYLNITFQSKRDYFLHSSPINPRLISIPCSTSPSLSDAVQPSNTWLEFTETHDLTQCRFTPLPLSHFSTWSWWWEKEAAEKQQQLFFMVSSRSQCLEAFRVCKPPVGLLPRYEQRMTWPGELPGEARTHASTSSEDITLAYIHFPETYFNIDHSYYLSSPNPYPHINMNPNLT